MAMLFLRRLSTRPKNVQNAAGIFHLQENLQRIAFGHDKQHETLRESKEQPEVTGKDAILIDGLRQASLDHLGRSGLLNQETIQPVDIPLDLPPLLGSSNLDEHFQKIGNRMLQPWLAMTEKYIEATESQRRAKTNTRLVEQTFVRQSGWTKYTSDGPVSVEYPTDDVITFDTEVLYNQSEYAVMASAISADHLYIWLSPWLMGESSSSNHLIPLGPHPQVVIGHHVGFDRKRVLEEYSLQASQKWFMDTMAFHIVSHGMCNQQRVTFAKYEAVKYPQQADAMCYTDPWLEHTMSNGLAATAKFYLDREMDKSDRDFFGELTDAEVAEPEMLQRLIKYCAVDTLVTRDLFSVLLPRFRNLNPHPVSMAALREMGNIFLPIDSGWHTYVERAETAFNSTQQNVQVQLKELAHKAAELADDPTELERASTADPWLKQLDWTIKPIRYTKAKKDQPSRPQKNQKMPGKPQWFRDLFAKQGAPISITARTRASTLLLRLRWDGSPLIWEDAYGWMFWAPINRKKHYRSLNMAWVRDEDDQSLFKLPHPDGDSARCTNPLAKFYLSYFESGTLSSDNDLAKEAIEGNLQSSYWLSSRRRIMSQMPVFSEDLASSSTMPPGTLGPSGTDKKYGMILPRMLTMGAVTRRAVEDTWLTASNAKRNRIGSELKANVRAPPGYKIIGADVDSEELWIAGVIGDAVFRMHGGTAFGWMTLEGTKKNGTDLHSKSASILGINRNEAKVFNYGRIYGSGETSAVRALRQFNPQLSVSEAEEKAAALYRSTKGAKTNSRVFPLKRYWRGGTESVMYNQLEMLAALPRQRTPVLGAGISNALTSTNLRKDSFMTTRVNWSIQSSGVDYLHLLIASMRFLCDVYAIDARLMLTVHDEVRYLVKDDSPDGAELGSNVLRAGLALQIANLWTRAMFCQQLGLESLPQSVAFFSAVDFDTVLRKEVDDPCVTPTQPDAVPPGEALDMAALVERCASLGTPDAAVLAAYEAEAAEPRTPVMAALNDSPQLLDYVRAQTGNADEAAAIEAALRPARRNRKMEVKNMKVNIKESARPSVDAIKEEFGSAPVAARARWRYVRV